jgi:D-arabinose 1-dehydrogenase-like Zn-dependent alcohol dehydrogenase
MTIRAPHLTSAQAKRCCWGVGIGGLGHLAAQCASKLESEVVALSGTEAKKEEALKPLATRFVATKVVKEFSVRRKISSHLLVTMCSMAQCWAGSSVVRSWPP